MVAPPPFWLICCCWVNVEEDLVCDSRKERFVFGLLVMVVLMVVGSSWPGAVAS